MSDSKPKYVKSPEAFSSLFARAERELAGFFTGLEFKPEKGEIAIQGERYIIARAVTFSVRLKEILEADYGRLAAEKIIYNLGRAAGTKDAEFFMKRLNLEKGTEALSVGPVYFAHSGWASVEILPGSNPTMDENYFLIYDHPYSFEADSYIQEEVKVERPVCHMNSGYSSGWCQVAFGIELTAREISCRARGDERCIFVMSHPEKINGHVAEMREKYRNDGKY